MLPFHPVEAALNVLRAQGYSSDITHLHKADEPVPEHVTQALRSNQDTYPAPVDALRFLGNPTDPQAHERRRALDVSRDYAPDLLRMARDKALYEGSTPDLWAPAHAVYALSEMDVVVSVHDLMPLLDIDHFEVYDAHFALATVITRTGPSAIGPLVIYLADKARWPTGHITAVRALAAIASNHGQYRSVIVDVLVDVLCEARSYHTGVCTEAITGLLMLDAHDAAVVIRRVYALNRVEVMVVGDWADVQRDLGLSPDPQDPILLHSRLLCAVQTGSLSLQDLRLNDSE